MGRTQKDTNWSFREINKKTNKRIGTNYERRIVRKGVYGFRRWGSLGLFDVEKLDYVKQNLNFMLIQNKFSTKKRPYISREEILRIKNFQDYKKII